MGVVLLGLGVMVAGGLASLLAGRSARASAILGAGSAVAGCFAALVPASMAALGAPAASLTAAWSVPYGSFSVELDALSAIFLVPVLGLSAAAAIYGGGHAGPGRPARSFGPSWFFFNLLAASMAMVVLARNAVLFLASWEVMTLASYFLVTTDHEKEEVRRAGWTYLVAAHLGTAFLLGFFVLMGREAGSLDFDRLGVQGAGPATASAAFLLAVIGFGTKAGFVPLHVWLPEAHPAAPSHVSAVMSGVMIKTGVYGLIRALTLLGEPPIWWGWLLIGVGAVSGVVGVLFALAQHDVKRLLAYHSVENVGIITMGLGVGLLGWSTGSPALTVLGFAGAIFHVLNHAAFKGLLFLCAGTAAHETGTREMDHLGGLLKRMPWTGTAFLIGAAAISGLPPLNGFASEFLIFLAALRGAALSEAPVAAPALGLIGALALIGGLAAACFAKAFGVVFLGEPRSAAAASAREPAIGMILPPALLAAACAALGLLAPWVVRGLAPAVGAAAGLPPGVVSANLAPAARGLGYVAAAGVGGALIVAGLWRLRAALLSRKGASAGVTWDCGYAAPGPRMQYTSSSFAAPLTVLFDRVLRARREVASPAGPFPASASLSTETPDVFRRTMYEPAFEALGRAALSVRWFQQGHVRLYVGYVALTLLVLLVLMLR